MSMVDVYPWADHTAGIAARGIAIAVHDAILFDEAIGGRRECEHLAVGLDALATHLTRGNFPRGIDFLSECVRQLQAPRERRSRREGGTP